LGLFFLLTSPPERFFFLPCRLSPFFRGAPLLGGENFFWGPFFFLVVFKVGLFGVVALTLFFFPQWSQSLSAAEEGGSFPSSVVFFFSFLFAAFPPLRLIFFCDQFPFPPEGREDEPSPTSHSFYSSSDNKTSPPPPTPLPLSLPLPPPSDFLATPSLPFFPFLLLLPLPYPPSPPYTSPWLRDPFFSLLFPNWRSIYSFSTTSPVFFFRTRPGHSHLQPPFFLFPCGLPLRYPSNWSPPEAVPSK